MKLKGRPKYNISIFGITLKPLTSLIQVKEINTKETNNKKYAKVLLIIILFFRVSSAKIQPKINSVMMTKIVGGND